MTQADSIFLLVVEQWDDNTFFYQINAQQEIPEDIWEDGKMLNNLKRLSVYPEGKRDDYRFKDPYDEDMMNVDKYSEALRWFERDFCKKMKKFFVHDGICWMNNIENLFWIILPNY